MTRTSTDRMSAGRIGIDDSAELEALIVGFSENVDGTGRTVLLQRGTRKFTWEEQKAGLDSYAISREHGATVYGGIKECWLSDHELRLLFDPNAASALDLAPDLTIEFLDPALDLSALRDALRRLFGGQDRPTVVSVGMEGG